MILLWDSSTMTASITLVSDDGERMTYEWEAGRSLARDMLAHLRSLLAEHSLTFADITGIGVNRGPGSYTGLRIGMTVLNTIASTQHIAIIGAIGDEWQDNCLRRLAAGEDDQMVLPEYGGDANITQPRK
jgi:tRNA threonylcarbamoyladenosine biosynthesis protein TsaB